MLVAPTNNRKGPAKPDHISLLKSGNETDIDAATLPERVELVDV